jgi:hypothetical protein
VSFSRAATWHRLSVTLMTEFGGARVVDADVAADIVKYQH